MLKKALVDDCSILPGPLAVILSGPQYNRPGLPAQAEQARSATETRLAGPTATAG
jgi:hypothetical protein